VSLGQMPEMPRGHVEVHCFRIAVSLSEDLSS